MPRKPARPIKAIKPPLPAICAAFVAGHDVRLTSKGPQRERRAFTTRDMRVAMSAMGAKRAQATAVLDWLQARGLVQHRGSSGDAYVMTNKGAHVTDRACKVFAKRGR